MSKEKSVIPDSYEAWKQCIETDCQIKITKAYLQTRLSTLKNEKNAETKKFIELYGTEHHQNVVSWHTKALSEF